MTPKLIKKYQLRAATETVTELCAHPALIRYTLLAILFWQRQAEIIDYLADLLDEIILKVGNKAKNSTRNEAVAELEKVQGKNKHILNLLKATVDHLDGIIQDTLYPIVTPSTIRDSIKDMTANNREYKEKIYIKMHSSYRGHYRRSLCDILKNLTFKSNNLSHQPIIEALQLIQEYSDSSLHFFQLGTKFQLKEPFNLSGRIVLLEQIVKG